RMPGPGDKPLRPPGKANRDRCSCFGQGHRVSLRKFGSPIAVSRLSKPVAGKCCSGDEFSLVKFPVLMRAILLNIMQKYLRQPSSLESFSPMGAFDAAIQNAISRGHLHLDYPIRTLEPKRPDSITS